MTDRVKVYQTEVPSINDILLTNRYAYIGNGRTADAILGSTTQLNGFACTPASPTPNLTADIDTGEIYQQAAVDTTMYVTLPADPTLIVKQGIFPTKTNFSFPAPITPGDAIDYLVQVGFLESDVDITSRPYYNTASPPPPAPPLRPIFVSNTSNRQDAAIVEVLAGTPAPYPSQVAPAPSPGTIGAWVVTVQYGQTQIISANINPYPGAPFITEKLKDKISEATADARYAKLTQFQSSLTENGYINLPGGLLIQWGRATLPATGVDTSSVGVSFPIPFTTSVFSVTTSFAGAPNPIWGHMSTAANLDTLSGFAFYGDTGQLGENFTQNVTGFWIAIGI